MTHAARYPFRRTIIVVEAATALAGAAGAVQLLLGAGTPDAETLEPLGLTTWTLPAVWLLASVTTPSAVAAVLAWRHSLSAPVAVLVASALLAIELVVQIPFLGPSALQAVMGTVAIAMALVALTARAQGWRPERAAVTQRAGRVA